MFAGLVNRFQSPLARFRSDYDKLLPATGSVPTTVAGLNVWGKSLDDLEHAIYAWFNSDPAPNEPDRIAGAALLDQIQQLHLTYIRAVRVTPGAAPYATGLDPDETAADGALQHGLTWNLVDNQVGLSVNEGGLDGFGDEVAAMHARLLSRPQGRHLIRDLMAAPISAQDPTVTIDGISLAHLAEVESAMKAILKDGESMDDYHEHAQAGPVAAHGRTAADAEATFTATGAAAGPGATTGVAIEQQYRDSTSGAAATSGAQHQRPVTPAFIVYGHELIHALHNKHGVNVKNRPSNGDHSQEEYETVGIRPLPDTLALLQNVLPHHITENDLRAEHSLPLRTDY